MGRDANRQKQHLCAEGTTGPLSPSENTCGRGQACKQMIPKDQGVHLEVPTGTLSLHGRPPSVAGCRCRRLCANCHAGGPVVPAKQPTCCLDIATPETRRAHAQRNSVNFPHDPRRPRRCCPSPPTITAGSCAGSGSSVTPTKALRGTSSIPCVCAGRHVKQCPRVHWLACAAVFSPAGLASQWTEDGAGGKDRTGLCPMHFGHFLLSNWTPGSSNPKRSLRCRPVNARGGRLRGS